MPGLPALVLAVLLAGCTPTDTQVEPTGPTTLDPWVASEMLALTDQTQRQSDAMILHPNGRTVQLFGAANETVSFQIVLDAGASLSGLTVQPSALTADGLPPIGSDRTAAWRMLPVKVTDFPAWYIRLVGRAPQPARYYDALVPADAPDGGQPWNVPAGERIALWIDITVPRDARGGTYTGQIALGTADGTAHAIPVELTLYDFVLPDARPLPAIGGFDHRTLYEHFIVDPDNADQPYVPVYLDPKNPKVAEGLDLIRQVMVLGHEHRLDLFDRHIAPKIRRDLYGEMALDWEPYDAIVRPYLDGSAFDDRIGSPAWPIPYRQDVPVPRYYGGIDSELYAQAAGQFLLKCGRHFRALGADDRMFAWPVRGEVSPQAYRVFMAMADIVRRTDCSIPVLARLPIAPPAETGWQPPPGLADAVDIVAPPGQWLDPMTARQFRKPQTPLAGVWLSPGRPPYVPALSVVSTPADVRALPWLASKYGCAAVFLPEVLNWRGDVFQTPAGAETRLFYPGKEVGVRGVLPSVRLKRLRRGLQDILYVWLLRQRQRSALAETVVNSMVHYGGLDAAGDNYLDPRIGGWVQDGELWIRARRMLAKEIAASIHPDAEPETARVLEQVRWVRFIERAQRLRVEQSRSYVRPFTPAPDNAASNPPRLQIVVEIELYNEYNHPIDARFRLKDLPEGWSADEPTEPATIPPRTRRRIQLVATGQELPPRPAGRLPLSVDVAWGRTDRRTIDLRVPFLAAAVASRAPNVDGNLDDWPVRPGFTAGAFRLIGRRGQSGAGLAERQTTAMVMQDLDNIYVAMICNEPDLDGMDVHADNRVRYEQLLAAGEDLVEIILDPGLQAQSASDLIHFVVKPNGVLVQERGIGSQPPLGGVTPLATGATVAVGRGDRAWTVEMRIPREALGPGTAEAFWGVNFARFATQAGEASNWAGAERYYYDPRNLGTMYVIPPPTAGN
jgi:hypothetical protein